jgi:hypothetical protein
MPLGKKSLSIIIEHMDAKHLDVVVKMVFYMPFDMIDGKGWLAHDANILSSTK